MDEKTNKQLSLDKVMNALNKKTDNLTEILQKFGMDFITKIGQQNMKINMLTDKIEDLHKAVIDVKGLAPQLSKVIERQKNLESEMILLKSLIQNTQFNSSSAKLDNNVIKRDKSITDNHQYITDLITELDSKLGDMDDILMVKEELLEIKTQIFERFGGHRVLYEISKYLKTLKSDTLLTEDKKSEIKDKLAFWKNKLI